MVFVRGIVVDGGVDVLLLFSVCGISFIIWYCTSNHKLQNHKKIWYIQCLHQNDFSSNQSPLLNQTIRYLGCSINTNAIEYIRVRLIWFFRRPSSFGKFNAPNFLSVSNCLYFLAPLTVYLSLADSSFLERTFKIQFCSLFHFIAQILTFKHLAV